MALKFEKQIAPVVEKPQVVRPAQKMQELEKSMNERTIMLQQEVRKAIDEQVASAIKFERDELRINLKQVHANILENDKYLKAAMECIESTNALQNQNTQNVMKELVATLSRMQTSNELLSKVIQNECNKISIQSEQTIANLGDKASKQIIQVVDGFKTKLEEVAITHQGIAKAVKESHQYQLWQNRAKGFLLYATFAMLCTIMKNLNQIDNPWSFIKIWSGYMIFK